MTRGVLVFDASPLIHFARADELEALRDLVKVFECVTTKAVLGELRNGAERIRRSATPSISTGSQPCRAMTLTNSTYSGST